MLIEDISVVNVEGRPDPSLRIVDSENSDNPHIHEIQVGAFASWGELLGFQNYGDTLEAILQVSQEGSDPTDSAWTDPYALLVHRETARAKEVLLMEEDPALSPQSPITRSTLAAHQAVHLPGPSGLCGFNRCRRDSRQKLGLPEVVTSCGATSRVIVPHQTLSTENVVQYVNSQGTVEEAPLQLVAGSTLQGLIPVVETLRRAFLGSQSQTPGEDPLAKYLPTLLEIAPEPEARDLEQDALSRYLDGEEA